MAKLLLGKPVSENIDERTIKTAEELTRAGRKPCLAVVSDDSAAGESYLRAIVKKAARLGVEIRQVRPEAKDADALTSLFMGLGLDDTVDAILPLRPFPKWADGDAAREAIATPKDVDCVSDAALAGVFTGKDVYAPCTAEACAELLDFYGIPLSGSSVVIIGRSLVVGKPLAMLILKKNATVTVCHSHTKGLAKLCKSADIVISTAGQAGLVTEDFMDEGRTVLVDVGVNESPDGGICGDATKRAEELTKAYTPVPGGVGAVTTSLLLWHTASAALKQRG